MYCVYDSFYSKYLSIYRNTSATTPSPPRLPDVYIQLSFISLSAFNGQAEKPDLFNNSRSSGPSPIVATFSNGVAIDNKNFLAASKRNKFAT